MPSTIRAAESRPADPSASREPEALGTMGTGRTASACHNPGHPHYARPRPDLPGTPDEANPPRRARRHQPFRLRPGARRRGEDARGRGGQAAPRRRQAQGRHARCARASRPSISSIRRSRSSASAPRRCRASARSVVAGQVVYVSDDGRYLFLPGSGGALFDVERQEEPQRRRHGGGAQAAAADHPGQRAHRVRPGQAQVHGHRLHRRRMRLLPQAAQRDRRVQPPGHRHRIPGVPAHGPRQRRLQEDGRGVVRAGPPQGPDRRQERPRLRPTATASRR